MRELFALTAGFLEKKGAMRNIFSIAASSIAASL